MPKIPTYDVPQEALRPLAAQPQNTVASLRLFEGIYDKGIARLAEGLNRTGADLAGIAAHMQNLDDLDKVTRAEADLTNRMTDFQIASRDLRGRDAVGLTEKADKEYDKMLRDVRKDLDPRQTRVFERIAARRQPHFRGSIAAHEARERETSTRMSLQSQREASALAVAADPMQAGLELQRVRQSVAAEASQFGLDDDSRKLLMLSETSKLHMAAISGLEANSAMALKYLEANKAEIAPPVARQIKEKLTAAEQDQKVEAITDRYEAQVRAGGMTMVQVLDDIGRKYSGDMEKRAKQDFKARIADFDAAREKEQRSAADQAWQIYSNTRRLGAIPGSLRQRMDGRDWLALEELHKRRSEGSVTATKTDWDTYYGLRRMAMENPAAFQKEDLRRYFSKLGRSELEGLIDIQTKARTDPAVLKDVATLEQQLGNARDMMGFSGSKDMEKRGLFDRAVTDAISAEERRTGKKLDYDQRQKVIDHFVIEGKIPGFLWDRTARRFEVVGTEDERTFLPTDKEIIRRFQMRHGRQPTQAELDRTKDNLRQRNFQ